MNSSLFLKHLNIVPRWIIFALDLSISILSLTGAYLIKYNFNFSNLDQVEYSQNVLLVAGVSVAVFFSLRIYSGIIRYTSMQDTFRILMAVLINFSIFFLFNLVLGALARPTLVPNSILVIMALSCFLLMVAYRITVKYVFIYIRNLKLDEKNVVIYGAGEAGVVAKRTFDNAYKVNKKITAFFDDDQRKVGKTIGGIKIYDSKFLLKIIAEHNVDELVFATYSIPADEKNKIVDICLENNVKVLNIPPHNQWANGELHPNQIQNVNIEDLLNRDQIKIDTAGIKSELHDKRILITGAAGSIGSEIVRQLLRFDAALIIMCDQAETALHHLYLELSEESPGANFMPFIGDVKDERRMEHLFDTYKPQYVYHAAAYKHVPLMEDNPSEAVKTNVLGTKTIADLSVKHGVKKFVMISTDKAVNPTNVMGASKRIAEMYVQSLNRAINSKDVKLINNLNKRDKARFITTRFGNVLGSNGSVIPRFKQQIEKGGPVTVTHPEVTRYFMTIPEACRLVLEAGCMGKGGEIYIFDMGKSVKIVELAKRMIKLAGLVPDQDIKIEFTGLRPGEKLFEELLNDNENTLPTHHEKIMIGQVREYLYYEIEEQIGTLISHALASDDLEVVRAMKKIVYEFKSENSIFEELDLISKAV
nr:nucleoside-diphosphate sugar epimerase/dehydratase [uncultured Mucilaginibacter sp.]